MVVIQRAHAELYLRRWAATPKAEHQSDRPWVPRAATAGAGVHNSSVLARYAGYSEEGEAIDHCGTCNRDAPPDGSAERTYRPATEHGARLTCPHCVARRIMTADVVLHEMETAEGWDQPPGRTPRQWTGK